MVKLDVNRREFLKITAGAGARLGHSNLRTYRCYPLQNDRYPGRSSFVCG
jgi:hypothetical protein